MNFINIKDYGASPEKHDNWQPITDAIAAAQQTSCRVYVPGKKYGARYHVSKPIIVPQYTRLIGDGPTLSIIRALPEFPFDDTGNVAVLIQEADYKSGEALGSMVVSYTKPSRMGRIWLDDLAVDGADLPNSNGILACLQQPAIWRSPRVQGCTGKYGLCLMEGQQAIIENAMLVYNSCEAPLRIRGHSFLTFRGFNSEGNKSPREVLIERGPGNYVAGSFNTAFYDTHIEMRGTTKAFEITAGRQFLWVNTFIGVPGVSSIAWDFSGMLAYDEPETRAAVYEMLGIQIGGNPELCTLIKDPMRGGYAPNAYTDHKGFLPFLSSGNHNWTLPPNAIITPHHDGTVGRL